MEMNNCFAYPTSIFLKMIEKIYLCSTTVFKIVSEEVASSSEILNLYGTEVTYPKSQKSTDFFVPYHILLFTLCIYSLHGPAR